MATAYRIQFPEPSRAELVPFEIDEPQGKQLLLQAEHSIISAGTEGASYTGLELEHPGRPATYSYPRLSTGYGHVSRIVAMGPDVTGYSLGDRVLTFSPHASRWLWDSARPAFPIPPDLPGERAVFIRMAGVGITALRRSSVQPGDTAAVIGLGLVGNFAAQLLQLAGAEVLGLDLEETRLRQAEACGVRHVASTRDRDVAEVVNEWTGGKGARILVEAIGSPELIDRAVQCTRRNGEVILLGSPRKRVTLDVTPMLSRIHLTGISMIGALEWVHPIEESDFSRFSVTANYRQIAGWIGDGRLVTDPLRTHVLSPTECAQAYHGLIHEKDRYTGVIFDWSRLSSEPVPNYFQAATSPEKLRGKYYTPAALVRLILESIQLGRGDTVLDPSCGDGEFLVGAVDHLAAQGVGDADELAGRIVGMDIDPSAVAAAKRRLGEAIRLRTGVASAEERLQVYSRSALELPTREALLAAVPHLAERLEGGRLVVVGNPPYVEAKRLPAAEKLALRGAFGGEVTGAADLYHYFLHACTGWLRGADRLAFVLPNKALVSASGRALRERLLDAGQVCGVDFATRAAVFPGAAVYPVVLYAGAPGSAARSVELGMVVAANGGLARRALPPLPAEVFAATETRSLFPSPPTRVLSEALLCLIRQIPQGRLDDVLEIRWSVSFHRRGLRERFVSREAPGSAHARRFLGGGAFAGNGEVGRYRLGWGGWWIDYNTERLRAEGNPLPPLELFERPKVVLCQNGRTLRAAYDAGDHVLKDTFLCGVPRLAVHPLAREPRALVGLLCSRPVHFFYAHVFFGGHVAGGYLHFLRSFLVDIPLGCWTPGAAAEVAALVQRRERAVEPEESLRLEAEIEARVEEAFGLTPEQRAALREWAGTDENWTARERVRGGSVPG